MLNIPMRALTLMVLAAPLGACSSFLGIHLTRHAPKLPAATEQASATPASPATEGGRKHLAAEQPGLAIEDFQKALTSGEPIAPAANGMGVAYARLGRYDLARRFFEQAMAADPADARYAENMTRMMRSPTLAMRKDADIATTAVKLAEQTQLSIARAAAVAPKAGSIQRVSRAEVRITTLPPQAAPIRVTTAGIDPRFKPLVRIAMRGGKPTSGQSFVRIMLPDAKPAETYKAMTSLGRAHASRRDIAAR